MKVKPITRRQIQHATKLVRQQVSFFNGWCVSEETMLKACEKAATKVFKYARASALREGSDKA